MGLTDKQQRFCEEYLIDLNATQAAIRAGYSVDTAKEQGCQLLTKLNIQEYIQDRREQIQSKLHITQERVLREYAKIAFCDPRKFFDGGGNPMAIDDLEDDAAGALAGFEIVVEKTEKDEETIEQSATKKIKFWDKTKALDSLAKHLGLFERDNDQKKQSGTNQLSDDQYYDLKKSILGQSKDRSVEGE